MTAAQKVRYEMLLRVRDFGAAHSEVFPEGSIEGEALTAIRQSVQEVETQAMTKVLATAAARRAMAQSRAAIRAGMLAIARTARGIRQRDPSVPHTFRMPMGTSDVVLVTAARAFISDGESLKERFAQHRLPASAWATLEHLVDAFDEMGRGRRAGRSSRTEAQARITAAIARGLDAARTLDVVMANVLTGDVGLTAAWKRDRRVEGQRRIARSVPTEVPSSLAAPGTALPRAS